MKTLVAAAVIVGLAGCGQRSEGPLFPSLQAAALDTVATWSPEQVELAAKITVRHLSEIEQQLIEADKKGDSKAAMALFDPMIHTLRTWNEHDAKGNVGKFRDCVLASVHLSEGVETVAKGGAYTTTKRFHAALDGCRPT